MAPHVIFIHGMYLNGQSWKPWVERFTSAGFSCSTPSWPHHDGDPRILRSEVDPDLGALTFGALTEHFKALIDALPECPILVGHSIGGLLVQRLVNDGFARAGEAVVDQPLDQQSADRVADQDRAFGKGVDQCLEVLGQGAECQGAEVRVDLRTQDTRVTVVMGPTRGAAGEPRRGEPLDPGLPALAVEIHAMDEDDVRGHPTTLSALSPGGRRESLAPQTGLLPGDLRHEPEARQPEIVHRLDRGSAWSAAESGAPRRPTIEAMNNLRLSSLGLVPQ